METATVTEMTSLWQVEAGSVDEAWEFVEQMVIDACARSGQYRAEDIKKDLMDGTAQLWIADHHRDGILGIMVTYLVENPLSKNCRIYLCVGEQRQRWMHHLATIEQWARDNGCDRVVAVVRPGWEKVMIDYKKTHVTLERAL